jgi:hypothetical protein
VTAETITAVAVEGEVITPQQTLKENEQIVKRNWQKATENVGKVYKALTIIHTNDLWKLHKDEKGKRKYTAFDQYLFGEFGWTLSRVRALQIIKATRQQMIEAGELPASAAEPRKRTAPEVTSERAAKVTADQLQKALDAFRTRVDSIDEGDPDRAEVVRIFTDVQETLTDAIGDLRDLVARVEAETTADESDDDADDDDEEVDAS